MHFRFTCILLLLWLPTLVFSQSANENNPITTSGNIQVNNNGISLVPSFALGRPAVSALLLVRKNRFTFNPQYNFVLDAKPWSVLIFHFRLI